MVVAVIESENLTRKEISKQVAKLLGAEKVTNAAAAEKTNAFVVKSAGKADVKDMTFKVEFLG